MRLEDNLETHTTKINIGCEHRWVGGANSGSSVRVGLGIRGSKTLDYTTSVFLCKWNLGSCTF